ncbi:TIGR04086 family membrane protein [uncultured Methanobacterium sp.]|uniref:TIGR04086 family membrane protein n=1 Tax=uncultured Methanobacterium sp. TaxID=176306 RepID=UPI0037479758
MDRDFFADFKNSLSLKAILIGLIIGVIFFLIVKRYDILSPTPIVFGCGFISGYIAGGKSKNGIINGFIGSLGYPLTLQSLFFIYYPYLPIKIPIFTLIVNTTIILIVCGLIGALGGLIGVNIKKPRNNGNNAGQKHLVCDKCGGYYELQLGESPEDFTDKCECGGNLKYVQDLNDTDE